MNLTIDKNKWGYILCESNESRKRVMDILKNNNFQKQYFCPNSEDCLMIAIYFDGTITTSSSKDALNDSDMIGWVIAGINFTDEMAKKIYAQIPTIKVTMAEVCEKFGRKVEIVNDKSLINELTQETKRFFQLSKEAQDILKKNKHLVWSRMSINYPYEHCTLALEYWEKYFYKIIPEDICRVQW